MVIWSTEPDSQDDAPAFRIVRTPANVPVTAIATAVNIVGTRTHFVLNRTIPCSGKDECEHCHNGHSSRWHGYLSCILVQTLEHVIFEMTKHAHDTFKNYIQQNGDIRGCRFTASRPSKRHNGRVVIAARPVDLQTTRLPDPPNVHRIMCHIWNVPYTPPESEPIQTSVARTIGRMHPDAVVTRPNGDE